MKQFLLHILCLVCICVVVANCRHEPDIDPSRTSCGEATTIDEMMEWVYFKTGTYWIYEEQNSGALDTFTVYYDYNGISNTGNREFVVKTRSSLDGYTYEYWFNDSWSGDCSLFPGCFCRAVDCDKYKPGDAAGTNHVFIFPLKVGSQVWQSGGGINFGLSKIAGRLSTDTIHNSVYQNVYQIQQDYSPQHNYQPSTYKIAAHLGILKKEIPGISKDWELIESLILQ